MRTLEDNATSESHRLTAVSRHFRLGTSVPASATNISCFIVTIFSFMTHCLHFTETEKDMLPVRKAAIAYEQHISMLSVKYRLSEVINLLALYLGKSRFRTSSQKPTFLRRLAGFREKFQTHTKAIFIKCHKFSQIQRP
jgi:hypothetical protein